MRAALISLAGQPLDAAGRPQLIAGRTVAERQLAFAIAAGAERIIALGDGAAPEAVALRHAAERAGARFQAIPDGHGLLGTVRTADQLLALAPGLVPEARPALDSLAGAAALLTLPAGLGVTAGFERIDRDRAWAGVVLVSGNQVERLAELPPDSEPAATLMRIALQARVPERQLPQGTLANGSWLMLGSAEVGEVHDAAWLERNLPPVPPHAPSEAAASLISRKLGRRLQPLLRRAEAMQAAVLAALAAAVALGWSGYPALGLGITALGAVLGSFTAIGLALAAAPFGHEKRPWRRFFPLLLDLAFVAAGTGALAGGWLHRLFPPLVLIAAVRAVQPERWNHWGAVLGDRAVLAALAAVAAALGWLEPALMAFSLLVLGLAAAKSAAAKG